MRHLIPLIILLAGQARGAEIFNTEKSASIPAVASQAAKDWKLPPGFRATAFASEPDVQQPIGMCLDARGRLWVAESYMYAGHIGGYYENKLRDRIIILEDTDGDGVHDKRTLFAEGLERLTSIEVGLGGVWALTLPQLVFIPDKNHDDVPDGPAVPLVDGFDVEKSAHTMANGLRWGPDGWLYGRQGILGHSLIGRPGASPEQRVRMNVGIWRYHPLRQAVEVVAEGTTNPWGMDWNEEGELFFINTVIGHLWHVIPGAHYKRMFGDDYNPYIFGLIDQHADHVHWDTAEKWSEIRDGMSKESSSAGGGHAHTGLMIYQGDNWPDQYRGDLFTINFHGRRLNREFLESTGSGYTGRHRADMAFSEDPWFRGIDLLYGPDGGVFISDWSDTGECHDDDGIHRQSGRIYKLTYGTPPSPSVPDVTVPSNEALVSLLGHKNEWYVRQAILALRHRKQEGENLDGLVPLLKRQLGEGGTIPLKLRALWALHAIGQADDSLLLSTLSASEPALRVWAVRLLLDTASPAGGDQVTVDALASLAAKEDTPRVRLALSSALQRLPLDARPKIASSLLKHGEDASDHNLPLMLWYGIEPLASSHRTALADLAKSCAIPLVRKNIARRLAMDSKDPGHAFDSLVAHATSASAEWTSDLLGGLSEALEGVQNPEPPTSWAQLSAVIGRSDHSGIRAFHRSLGALFRDPSAISANLAIASDAAAPPEQRSVALRSLTAIREPGSVDLAKSLVGERGVHGAALERLAAANDPSVPAFLLGRLPALSATDLPSAIDVMVSRAPWAVQLLDFISSGKLPASSLSPFQVRQIRSLEDPALAEKITALWGEVRESPREKAHAVEIWKRYLTPKTLSEADKTSGKALFGQYCGACHKMNGEGGMVGPELTGSGRDNLDYLLTNLIDPGAVVAKENQLSIVTMKDGRVLSGMIRTSDARTTALQTLTDKISLPTPEIARTETLPNSLMPEGMLEAMSREQARDLIGWLMDKNPSPTSAAQPLPVEISLNGDWEISVKLPDGTATALQVSPPVWREVSTEKFSGLPVYNPKGGGWNNGAKFSGNVAEVCSTPDLVDVASVVLTTSPEPDAPALVRGKDWEIEPSWGTFGRLEGGAISPDAEVFARYRHTFLRIDSVARLPDSSVILVQGSGTSAAPAPPDLPAGAIRLANVWIPGPIKILTPDHLFPILENAYGGPPPEVTFSEKFPRLMEKIRSGEPIRILAWGDSVTAGGYLPAEQRWQKRFLSRLRERYPEAKIELHTEAWPGRTTTAYLNEPPGAEHNYGEKVLALKPDLVISEFVNDASLPAGAYERAYPEILKDLQAIGTEWIILTPHYIKPSWMGLNSERGIDDDPRDYVNFIRKFASTQPILLADAAARYGRLWRKGIPHTSLMVNSVNHPNAEGMEIFVDALMDLFPEP